MYNKVTTIINETGLHARPASVFAAAAKKFEATVCVKNLGTGQEVNGKSVVRILSAGLKKGTRIEIAAEGSDAVQAVDTLTELVDSGFDEMDANGGA